MESYYFYTACTKFNLAIYLVFYNIEILKINQIYLINQGKEGDQQ